MAVSGFLIKTPEHTQPADALDEVLKMGGNRLLLAYGGVRYAEETKQDYDKLRTWLKAATDNHLTLIFGVWGNYTVSPEGEPLSFTPFKDQIDQMRYTLKNIFDFSLLPVEIVDQIHVYGIANFHPKVMYLSRKDKTTDMEERPVALQVGSSNFTGAARRKIETFQYELDLFLHWDCPEHKSLISNFAAQWKVLLKATRKYNVGEFNIDLFFDTFGDALEEHNEKKINQYILEGLFDVSID